jgi:hypothetical protein
VSTTNGGGGSSYTEEDDWPMIILGFIVFLFMIGIPCFLIFKFFQWIFSGLGFGSSPEATEKKIVRTKIEYYETCPSCGAGRVEGKDECPYCGRSMIKSKEIVEEKDLSHDTLFKAVKRYYEDPNLRREIANRSADANSDEAKIKILKIIDDILCKKEG